jgi:predicted metal-binding membrane protein
VRSPSPVATVPGRDRVLISICILLITGLAWAYLIHLARQMSSSMEYDEMMAKMGMAAGTPWTAIDVFFTFVMWTVMMVGMMAGSAAPVLLLFANARAARGDSHISLPVLSFGGGYLAIWVGFSACAAITQWALHETAMLSAAMALATPRVAGAVLVAAGVYQLTPMKRACLTHCRSPLGFLMTGWRDGTWGAFQMGARHGTHCLGCCWALMCVLFAVGVMNLLWVAMLTGVVLLEKVGPAGALISRVAGVGMIAFGIFVIAS